MPDHSRRFDSMLFNYQTTNRTDFQYRGPVDNTTRTVYRAKQSRPGLAVPPQKAKYVHTLEEWQTPCVPFELFVKPKDIVRTNPWDIQQRYIKPRDYDWENVVKTRPRLVMTPAVSLDDVQDNRKRAILIQDTYQTETSRALQQAVSAQNSQSISAPLPETYSPASPIYLPKLKARYVSPEWRKESVAWDRQQLRADCDPTKEFWLSQRPKLVIALKYLRTVPVLPCHEGTWRLTKKLNDKRRVSV